MRTSNTTRSLPALAAAVACSLTLAACGGDDAGSGNGRPKAESAYSAALKFSRCMRQQGIDMPDPQQAGGAKGGPGDAFSGINPSDPAFKTAEKACAKHLKGGSVASSSGDAPSAKDKAKAEAALLKFSRCMREHGIDFPDPKNGAVTIGEGTGLDPDDPAFKEAQKACADDLPLAPAG